MVFNQQEHLKKVHQNRRAQTLARVNQAIHALKAARQPINFSRVAKQAKIGKSTLYSIPEVKEKIVLYRQESIQQSYKQKQSDSKSDCMIHSLKRKIRSLESENKELKFQIKKMYGKLFEGTIQK